MTGLKIVSNTHTQWAAPQEVNAPGEQWSMHLIGTISSAYYTSMAIKLLIPLLSMDKTSHNPYCH